MAILWSSENAKWAESKCHKRGLVGSVIITIAILTCALVYSYCPLVDTTESGQNHLEGLSANPPFPNVFICATERKPNSILRRSKRGDPASLIKRVARPLSPAPPTLNLNGSYDPPLYHDAGAKCAWGHITGRRVPQIEESGVSYDSQQLGARACENPEICKTICLRMHKTDDPYLCNYFTWNREKKVALFYFLEPTIKWNLTLDDRVETYFWQCRETPCTWFWRPSRMISFMADMTATQLRSANGLIAVSQCVDFATCQFSCETRPSFKEAQELGQRLADGVNPDDPTCDYIVMPSTDSKTQFSFLFSMRQSVLKNATYKRSSSYDTFQLICKDSPLQPASKEPNAIVPAPPSAPHTSQKRAIRRLIGENDQPTKSSKGIQLRDCRTGGQQVDCSKILAKETEGDAECVQLDVEGLHTSNNRVSLSVEATSSVWLSAQKQGFDSLEEHVALVPGKKHSVDMRLKDNPVSPACGSSSSMDRRCAATCNDRLAIDVCGCSVSADQDTSSSESLVSLPQCTDEQLRSCIVEKIRSDDFFSCMNDCKKDCSAWHPFIHKESSVDKLLDTDVILDFGFGGPVGKDQDEVWWNKKEYLLKLVAPVLIGVVILMVIVYVVFRKC